MKKILSLILCMSLLFGSLAAAEAESELLSLFSDTQTHTLERKTVPFYHQRSEGPVIEDAPLWILDGVADVPYMDLNEIPGFMNTFLKTFDYQDEVLYTGAIDPDTGCYMLTYNPTSVILLFDMDNDAIMVSDYDMINRNSSAMNQDMLSYNRVNEQTLQPELFERIKDYTLIRPGTIKTIYLGEYGLKIIQQDGKILLPMQTLLSFLIGVPNGTPVFYNGEAIFCGGTDMFVVRTPNPETGMYEYNKTELGKLYYGAGPKKRSEALAEFGLSELCLEMDCFYGLKESHDIDSFYDLISDLGMTGAFLDPDPAVADQALMDLINYYLDDMHSAYVSNSWMTGTDASLNNGDGYSYKLYAQNEQLLEALRNHMIPDGMYAYQEVDDTAYINFDKFVFNYLDYYSLDLDKAESIQDTASLIMFAHHQITRENSPIRNVVINLTLNGGGDVDAAIFLLAWFLGDAQLSVADTFTGTKATNIYHVDVNADHVFDNKDSIVDTHNLYCMISPVSFSCGNLVPWAFHASGLVTLIGNTSGGGSCIVQPMSTAWGTVFQTSGPNRMSFVKNGSYYDVDKGVDPDIHITKPNLFFDFTALTNLIHESY